MYFPAHPCNGKTRLSWHWDKFVNSNQCRRRNYNEGEKSLDLSLCDFAGSALKAALAEEKGTHVEEATSLGFGIAIKKSSSQFQAVTSSSLGCCSHFA